MNNGKARPSPKNSPVIQYVRNSKFKERFANLEPATDAFDSAWTGLAASQAEEFEEDQHDYIKRKYYDVMIANLQRVGIDLTRYGPAVQDLVWSTAVQFGPARVKIFSEPLQNKSELTDADIINLVSEYKLANVDVFFKSSSQSIKDGVRKRYRDEKTSLLGLIRT
jgi:hypothetical protein